MKIVLIAQEEPIYFAPFFQKMIEAKKEEIALVIIVGNRGAGNHPKGFLNTLKSLYTLWLIFEPYGFLRNLWLKRIRPKNSIERSAHKNNLPVLHTSEINGAPLLAKLKEISPDVLINQSEVLLKKELLSIPKIGTLNRHASYLPHFRGRLGSFWAHQSEPPEYATTIHFVDEAIDSGPIILQKKHPLNPALSYTKVLDALFLDGSNLMLEALDLIEKPGFTPIANQYQGTKTYLFPSLKEAKAYREVLKKRRKPTKNKSTI